MTEGIQIISRETRGRALGAAARFGPETAARARRFHQSFPAYEETPLVSLENLAAALGVGGIYIKDESHRFGLQAFKVLGGSWCIGNYIARRLGWGLEALSFAALTEPETRAALGELCFVTATDGNHGRGIAWTAAQLGQRSVVFMPKGSAPERLAHIRALGAEAAITDCNYDDSVRLALAYAEEQGGIFVQDTAWEGYEEIPGWIMEGYTTMALEAVGQLGNIRPTHIFLQAGVGAMAGAVAGFFAAYYGPAERPVITIVEPNRADCLFRTARADDGRLHTVDGDLDTIMAGLACGEPCSLGWEVLRDHADHFISMPDAVAARGMRMLGNPLPGDPQVISGESGAATLGLAATLLQEERLCALQRRLGLGPDSRILCFSTEGDTDRRGYRRVVWDGAWPSTSV